MRAAQRLGLGFLIDAEDDRIGGRLQVQPHHIVNLRLGVGVGAEFDGLRPMRSQRMRPPNAVDGAVGAPPHLVRQVARTPVGQAARGRFQRQG